MALQITQHPQSIARALGESASFNVVAESTLFDFSNPLINTVDANLDFTPIGDGGFTVVDKGVASGEKSYSASGFVDVGDNDFAVSWDVKNINLASSLAGNYVGYRIPVNSGGKALLGVLAYKWTTVNLRAQYHNGTSWVETPLVGTNSDDDFRVEATYTKATTTVDIKIIQNATEYTLSYTSPLMSLSTEIGHFGFVGNSDPSYLNGFTVENFLFNPINYQWEKLNETWQEVVGETSDIYTIPTITTPDFTDYRVNISDGFTSIYSDVATLSTSGNILNKLGFNLGLTF